MKSTAAPRQLSRGHPRPVADRPEDGGRAPTRAAGATTAAAGTSAAETSAAS